MNRVTKFLSVILLTTAVASAGTLVTVNGNAITQEDVDTALMNATQGRLNQVPPAKQAQLRQQVLQQLIGEELIYDDAKQIGVLTSQEYKDEYKKLELRMKRGLAIQVWKKEQLDKIKISDKALREYYEANKGEFEQKESVHARHILVNTPDEATAIIDILKSLHGNQLQSKFIELAKERSTGPSGPKGGDLGYFSKGQMVPAFNDKVFSMKVGSVTKKPVQTKFGYHVIYLQDKKTASVRPFKEVKPFIEQRLKFEKFQDFMKEKMNELQKKATIK